MGMDLYGTSGNYFRANIWSWPAILQAIEEAGYTPPPSWSFNDGAGLSSQPECDDLAEKLDAWLHSFGGDIFRSSIETAYVVADDGTLQSAESCEGDTPYQTSRAHLEQFVTFLRSCAGFEIC